MDEILGDVTSTSLSACEPNQLKDYFNKLLPPILGAEGCDLENSLWSSETIEKLKRFINDPQAKVIYFSKKRENSIEVGKMSFQKYIKKQVYKDFIDSLL